jgi:hypothetical protein
MKLTARARVGKEERAAADDGARRARRARKVRPKRRSVRMARKEEEAVGGGVARRARTERTLVMIRKALTTRLPIKETMATKKMKRKQPK